MSVHINLPVFLFSVMVILTSCGGGDEAPPETPEGEGNLMLVSAFPGLQFDRPLDLQSPDDGTNRIFVAEQEGIIRGFANDPQVLETTLFLDIRNRTHSGGEMGLLGFVFHPDFETNGNFYVYYTPSPAETILSRFHADQEGESADAGSETVLLRISQPFTNHNGGQLAFGPDGYLFLAIGDGGSAGDPMNNAQNLGNLLGKILRINIDAEENGQPYAIPPDNPFIDLPDASPEIYAYGLRNPWRFSFDTLSSDLWVADVGQGEREEINLVESGGNYGWNILEGTECYGAENCLEEGYLPPVFEYDHSAGDESITGGLVYRGQSVPALYGRYVYADFISGRIWALDSAQNPPLNTLLAENVGNISSFGTDSSAELYLCSFDGNIYKFSTEE